VKLANEIHVPVGERVTLELESADVIHSFWAPNLHGKTDLIPGQVNRTTLRVDKEGAYRGQCAEYCGTQHAHMAFWVVAEPKEKFEAWLAAQRKPAPEPADATLAKGREVFLAAPCAMCHAIQGTPAHASVAPDLTHVATRRTLGAGTIPNTTGHLAGWVVDSHGIKPGNQMPPNPMDSDDLQALLAYLGSLK
jgi:cytochrome c oxidase subunit 2